MAIPMVEEKPFLFRAEKIAYWFFRLNGCFSLENFLVHAEIPNQGGTEVDVLGIRLPYRKELSLSEHPMDDHPLFTSQEPKIDIIIADATIGRYCKVNSPWTDPAKPNMRRILRVLGMFATEQEENEACRRLYEKQFYQDEQYRINIFALGKERNTELPPAIIQVTWEEVLVFIHQRFVTYEDYKTQNIQWDDTGKNLFQNALNFYNNQEKFVTETIRHMIN